MFLEKLKLQLFAATQEEDPEISEQDDENVEDLEDDVVDEELDDIDGDEEDLPEDDDEEESEEEEETEEEETAEEDKPFMIFKSKDEHQAYMDNVIGKRLGEQRKKNEDYDNLLHTFEQYFEVEGIDGLKKKSEELLDDIAYQKGTTKEQLIKQQKEQQELRSFRVMQENQRQQAFLNAFNNDCDKLSKSNPELYGDIKSENLLQNQEFLQMLGVTGNFKKAYDATYADKIMKSLTTKVKKNTLDNVKAKPTRISENAAKKTKPASIKLDPSKMTDEQLADLEERAARGEKIIF